MATSSKSKEQDVVTHSLYDLFLGDDAPSPTRWYTANAEEMPQRLLRLLQAKEKPRPGSADPAQRGYVYSGPSGEEVIHVKDVRWSAPADLVHGMDEERDLVRELEVVIQITGPSGKTQELVRSIPDVPFPTPWGTYVKGANQTLITNKLTQKPGVFPVNLDERARSLPGSDGILWHTPFASVMQTREHLVAMTRSLISGARNEGCMNIPVTIPRNAWVEFDAALKSSNFSTARLSPADYPQLAEAFQNSMRLASPTPAMFDRWIRDLAGSRVPAGSWTKRWDRLGMSELNRRGFWSLAASKDADRALEQLPRSEYIAFNSLARMRVQTGADLVSDMLSQKIGWLLESHLVKDATAGLNAKSFLTARWASTHWHLTRDLLSATHTGTERNNTTLSNDKTPAETAMRVNLLIREGHIFALPDGISEIQRQFHVPSSAYLLSPMTMENEHVGNALHLLPQTRVRNDTGELETVFVVEKPGATADAPPSKERVYLNSEEIEVLEADLRRRGLGVMLGRPEDTTSPKVTLFLKGQPVCRVARDQVPAYFDAAPGDVLALALRMSPGQESVEVARHAMGIAFMAGASSCNGSRPDQDFAKDARDTCALMLNSGKAYHSPVAGTVEAVERKGRIGRVQISGDDGRLHVIEFPVDLSNAFSNSVGIACTKKPGERIEPAEYLLAPSQACVLNAIKAGVPGVFPSVPLKASQFSLGEEDLLILSRATAASGRLSIVKQANAKRLSGDRGDIRIAVAHPGTMIYPGMILGWQQTAQPGGTVRWTEVRAGHEDRGILANVFVVPDSKGKGGSVCFADEANVGPNLHRQVAELLAGVRADFDPIADGWKPDVVTFWQNQGADVRSRFETASYRIPGAAGEAPISRTITLADLRAGPGHPSHDQLCRDLCDHAGKITFGSADGSCGEFEERLQYTQQMVETMVERASVPLQTYGLPTSTKSVVFSIFKELPISDGDKLTALGTKGSVRVVHPQELPMTVENGKMAPTDIAYTSLGFVARSSYGDMAVTASGPSARTVNSYVWDRNRGLLIVPVVQGTYRAYRQGESNPDTAASVRGVPEPELDLSRRNAGYSLVGTAQDGRSSNRADHTLAADIKPAIESSYMGPRYARSLMQTMPELRQSIERDIPVTPAETIPSHGL